jgi:ABC-type sulfate/molybdate transport systems ATPase subunit
MTPLIRLERVVRRFRAVRTGRTIEALRADHFEVERGEILGVVGPNGSGKSTLLEMMAFLVRPDEGRVLLDGRDVWADGDTLAARRRAPMLLQNTVLFKTTVLKNVTYGLRVRGVSRAEARQRAERVLGLVQLGELAHRMYRELSGGERQRVALARVLALEPEVLLLDEPTAHVDYANAQLIDDILRDLHARSGTTIVLASHDRDQAASLAHRVVTLREGRLVPGKADKLR